MSTRRRNRWRTFSLRSFLILVTLTGLSAGSWITMIQPMQRQWESADRFLALGAEIETQPSDLPWLVKQFLPADRNSNVTMLQLKRSSDLGDALKGLKHLPHLERLYLTRDKIEDEDIVNFSHLKKLKRLALWGNRLTDASAAQLASLPNLEVIDLKKNQFSWRALLEFQDRPNVNVRHDFLFDNATSAELKAMVGLNNQTSELTLQDYAPGMVSKAFQWLPNLTKFTHENWCNFNKDDWQAVITAGNDRKCSFLFRGKAPAGLIQGAPLDSPGWSAAEQLLRPTSVDIRGLAEYWIRFSQGKSFYHLVASGNFSDLKGSEFFLDTSEIELASSGVRDLSFLQSAKRLKSISVSGCPQLTDISGLPGLVYSFKISRCESLQRVTGWENSKLRYLTLSGCPQLDSLEGFEKFTALEWLKLQQLPKLSSLSSLEGLNTLYRLELRNVSPALSLSSLPTLKKLYTLDLSLSESLRNLNGMKELPALGRVNLYGCSNLEQIVGIQANRHLREVNLNETLALKSLQGLSGDQLRKLSLENSGVESLEGLDGLGGIEELTISRCKQLVSCGNRFTIPNLKELRFEDCPNLTDLSGLHAPQLSVLAIGGGSYRHEILFSDLGKLPQFRKLDRLLLSCCKDLRSLATLRENSQITEASFTNCSNLVDFSGGTFQSMLIDKIYMDASWETEGQTLDLTPLQNVKKLKLHSDYFARLKGLDSLDQLQELDLNGRRVDVNSLRLHKNLQALKLEDDRSTTELTILDRLPNLKILELEDCNLEKLDCRDQIQRLGIKDCPKIRSFRGFKKLTEVNLWLNTSYAKQPADLSFLSAASNLRTLQIVTYRSLGDFDFLKQTNQLQKFALTWKYSAYNSTPRPIPPDLSPLAHCQNLKMLELDSCGLPGIEGVAKLDQIRDLRLGEFPFADLELASQMPDLEVLSLKACENLKSLAGIEGKAKLRSILIEKIRQLPDYSKVIKTLPVYDSSDDSWRRRDNWWTVSPVDR